MDKLTRDFFERDVLEVAPDLLGKYIFTNQSGIQNSFQISEVEAYKGMEDLACHASKGKTNRTQVMFHRGGELYVYLIYGIHWLLNIVTGKADDPQAVLIRGVENCSGPGRVSRLLNIDRSYYGEDLVLSNRIWIADGAVKANYNTSKRIGIDYAGEYWKNVPWRYIKIK